MELDIKNRFCWLLNRVLITWCAIEVSVGVYAADMETQIVGASWKVNLTCLR